MNILILSATTGGGHMKAAKAVQNHMTKHNKEAKVEIIDTIEYINPILNSTITNGYVYLATKTPRIYGKIYELTNKENQFGKLVTTLNNMASSKLLPLIQESKADIIITTHPFPTAMVSILKGKDLINIPLICIMTDYAPHKAWINDKVDSYIVSNENMKKEMIKLGVKEQSVCPYGIPVEESFFNKEDKEKILNYVGLDSNKPTILMMAGSFGVKNVFDIYEKVDSISLDIQFIVITGKNKKLYDEFEKNISKSPRTTKLIYFTNEVSKYMKAADIIITKPGGLTITEAISCNTPMVIFNGIPGQEEQNAKFLVDNNMAIEIDPSNNCEEIIKELLIDKNRLTKMKNACKLFQKSECTYKISMQIDKLKNKYDEINKKKFI